MPQDDSSVLVQELAAQLGETEGQPIKQLSAIVKYCGADFARQILQETLAVEAKGGLMVKSGARRRTPGGVFFHLARQQMTGQQRRKIFGAPKKEGTPSPPPPPPLPPFDWSERVSIISPLIEESGKASTVKITLIGRPGKIETRKDLVITAMTHSAGAATLPKGVPKPPETPTLYTVYIAAKQWKRVEPALSDPEDMLIIEGTASYDPEIQGVAIFAQSVTSKGLEKQKREAQKGAAPAANAPADAAPAASKPLPPLPPEPPPDDGPAPEESLLLPDAPLEVNQKLAELYAAASLYRQKIAALAAKPANQQFGLEMTRKLLQNTEAEIAAIEQKYGG